MIINIYKRKMFFEFSFKLNFKTAMKDNNKINISEIITKNNLSNLLFISQKYKDCFQEKLEFYSEKKNFFFYKSRFSLNDTYDSDEPTVNKKFKKYPLTPLATRNDSNTIIDISITRGDSFISLQTSYLASEFEVLENADNTCYVDADYYFISNY